MASSNVLVLFDMSNFIHRSYYSLSPDKFRREDGLATNSLYGTLNIVMNIINLMKKEYQHVYPVACFDTAKSKLARMNIDENYKSQRPSAPNELKHQFAWVRTLIDTMSISSVSMDTCEADDVIASIVYQNKQKYDKIVIVSTDKDFNQCLTQENICIYNIAKKIYVDGNDVVDKYKVLPSNFVLYQALIGDKIDNIPGVKGIGPKIAPSIVNQANGSLTQLHTLASDNVLPKNKSKLIVNNYDVLTKSYELACLKTDLNIENKFAKFDIKNLKSNNNFKEFMKSMNFNSFVRKYC
jgi:DNA polymerase-1